MNDPIEALRDSYHETTLPEERLEVILTSLTVDAPSSDSELSSGMNGSSLWIQLGFIGLIGVGLLIVVLMLVWRADKGHSTPPFIIPEPERWEEPEDIEMNILLPISNGVVETDLPHDPSERREPDSTPMGSPVDALGGIPAWQNRADEPTDKPTLSITADNMEEHALRLTEGHQAMFKQYPETWHMVVYPTHRTATLPEHIYLNCHRNLKHASLTDSGNGITGALPGVAFPHPANGNEAIWNHLFRYRGKSLRRKIGQAVPMRTGKYTLVELEERALWLYGQDHLLSKHIQLVQAPSRLAGEKRLLFESSNQSQRPLECWRYNKDLHKIVRSPNDAHDFLRTASDGQATVDNTDMFSGSPERYTWTLSGPMELYVPYNAHQIDRARPGDLLRSGHINQNFARYELHRVWRVDGELKNGASHIYSRRTCYLDEDSWQILHVDHYDRFGQLWRVGEAHTKNYGDFIGETLQCLYDLKNGRYFACGLQLGEKAQVDIAINESIFSPEALVDLH